MTANERRKVFHTFLFPSFFLLIIWLIKISELVLEKDFSSLGVYPRKLEGLAGLLFSPLLHGSLKHIFSNTFPVFFLSLGLFYFYPRIAYRVFFAIYLAVGLWVWVAARPSYHIGASGVVYGLAAFHFLSGIIRRHGGLMAFSLVIVFLYGGMVWGVLPLEESISWESHALGVVGGVLCAVIFRKEGPQRKEHKWEDEDDGDNSYLDDQSEEPQSVDTSEIEIKYEYVEKEK